MARNSMNKCTHLDNVIQLSLSELCKLKQSEPCSECDANGPNLWICLQKNCLHIGCSEQCNDHSTSHFKTNHAHSIHMNLSSQRIWCYVCEIEVFVAPYQRRNSIISNDSSDNSRYSNNEKILMYDKAGGDSGDSSADEDDVDRHGKWNGLVGLQNIANTCYMNAAIQALSNTPPLTGYFLDCGSIIETDLMNNQARAKPGLAKNYYKLVKEMWCKNRRYVVPNGILYGIRIVHPMFRGFQQHDTQEFLRCFMDQLHEELKEVTPPPPELPLRNIDRDDENSDDQSPCPSPSPSQSEAEYETCDSGVSEQSSLSDDTSINSKRNRNLSRSPSPTSSQRNKSRKQSPLASNRTSSSSSLSSPVAPPPPPPPPSNNQNQKSTKDKLPHRSIISDIFDGKLLSSVQCLTCDRISTREETFQDVSLPIPGKDHLAVLHQSQGMPVVSHQQPSSGSAGVTCTDAVYQVGTDGWFWWFWNWFRSWFWGPAVSLHDCMAAFFSADELKGDNMYSCEKCNKLRNGVKYSRVLALPEMLCVHLKRFRHDLSYSSKISSPVRFPLSGLDMRPYLHKDCKSEVTSYDLCAVICHHGTVGSGHYTSFAKHEPTGKWFEFDDLLVTQVQPEYVQNCEAYVLFYRKNNSKMSVIRTQALDLINMQEHASDIRFYVSKNWLHRFNTFAEPGPIDNWTLLCPHGGMPPGKAATFLKLVVMIPQPLWDFLYKKFGGGPACNHIFPCDICKQVAESLARRQRAELEEFTLYNDEFQYNDNSSTIYAISMIWFRQWQLFARGLTNEEPGPIDNKSIIINNDYKTLRQGSDCAQINSTLWRFFHNIYGGGPEIILRGTAPTPADIEASKLTKEKEKEVEPMDVQDEPIAAPKSNIKQESKAEPVTSTSDGQTQTHKPTKSVSFEDSDSIADSNDLKSSSVTSSVPEFVIPSLKKSKYNQQPQSPPIVPLEIGSKKDKRHRSGMKTSGLFGAEGKYSDHQYQNNIPDTNNIPRTGSFSQNSSTSNAIRTNYALNNSSSLPSFQKPAKDSTATINSDSGNDSMKKVDEIMPLLHQTSISNEDIEDHGQNSEASSRDKHRKNKVAYENQSGGGRSTSYRKKLKSKYIKKMSKNGSGDTVISDSEKF